MSTGLAVPPLASSDLECVSTSCLYPSVAATLNPPRRLTIAQHARRVGIGAGGGLICAVGAVLTPLPGPGLLIIGAGMMVLGTEFPAARRTMDRGVEALAGAIEGGGGLVRDGGNDGTESVSPLGGPVEDMVQELPSPASPRDPVAEATTDKGKLRNHRVAAALRTKARNAGRAHILPVLRKHLDSNQSRGFSYAVRGPPVL